MRARTSPMRRDARRVEAVGEARHEMVWEGVGSARGRPQAGRTSRRKRKTVSWYATRPKEPFGKGGRAHSAEDGEEEEGEEGKEEEEGYDEGVEEECEVEEEGEKKQKR